ncbi:MAG TPA: hypothetical protein VLH38_03205 [Patescibacteria group bacterium]|nr:hypothetical protein [Patescibacteria group bacterium]
MDQHITKKAKVQAGVSLVVLATVIVGTAVATRTKPNTTVSITKPAAPTSASTTTQTAVTPTPTTPSTTSGAYKDGTYKATGGYNSPGGIESIEVSVTLSANTVVESTVVADADDPSAKSYQDVFVANYKTFVVGKNIADIKLGNVSGSSLTSEGFNNALDQIKRQAQS